ncbi:glycosyltransferase family 2 protein [Paenibacillus roseipurpureus]|uniref:Glycosyltransferase family A protein n=1 Tax=Paenibacillus roseopurpureus TaxID=2918901 RepID=A0AA96RJL2_9BACL|nr:glycosyltransferase family A protein [Paenibacillus sp. MBLB1832]WNR43429.1 glycosyltransferase family A protein [Paenibacillus sp. MBLB1832]
MKTKKQLRRHAGVSVITVTNKPDFMKNIIRNYRHQTWSRRELIIVLNHHRMKPSAYRAYAKRKGVQASVFKLPEKAYLGECLNYGIRRARFKYIAKFDDDDYYGPAYLGEAVHKAESTKADLVGKNQFYMYMVHTKQLLLVKKGKKNSVAGATLVFRRSLFPRVKFKRIRAGSDMMFLQDVWKRGGKTRTVGKLHFAAIRRANQSRHTWKINQTTMRNMRATVIARTGKYEGIVRGLKRR